MRILRFGTLSKSLSFVVGKSEGKKMIKYRMIEIEDYNDEPVQFAAVYVTKWDDVKRGLIEEPDCFFVEMEEDAEKLDGILKETEGK